VPAVASNSNIDPYISLVVNDHVAKVDADPKLDPSDGGFRHRAQHPNVRMRALRTTQLGRLEPPRLVASLIELATDASLNLFSPPMTNQH
jgi:hypothetical protein